jgi:hypothetical protein
MATVNEGSRVGIDRWGCVHDCFATSPNNIASLVTNVSKFAQWQVFGKDWLADLHQQFEKQAGVKIVPPPAHEATLTHEFMLGQQALKP